MPSPAVISAAPRPLSFSYLPFSNAWSAESVSNAAGVLTWNPLRGNVPLTLVLGTESAAPTADSLFNNRNSVRFTGNGQYGGTIPAPGSAQTLVVVSRTLIGNGGYLALTTAGTPNTGSSVFHDSTIALARRLSSNSGTYSFAVPGVAIHLTTLTTAAAALYVNSKSSVATAGSSSAFSATDVRIGGLGTGPTYPLQGAVAFAGVCPRVMVAAEIAACMDILGAYYGQTIAP